jgi:hypothetical protein
MNTLPAADPRNILFETRLVEEEDGEPRGDGRRLGSRVSFGEPAVYDLLSLAKETGADPGFEIRSQLDRYEFRLVRLISTLHVEPRSAVGWLEIHVALAPAPSGAERGGVLADDPADPPIAYDLYPLQVVDKVQVEHTAKISPSFQFKEITASLGEDALTVRYERLEPRITAYGRRETTPYWRYTPGTARDVAGGVREMDLIVRRPRGVPVRATILAKGSGRQWGIFPAPVTIEGQQFDI